MYTGRERGGVEPWAPAALQLQLITISMLSVLSHSTFFLSFLPLSFLPDLIEAVCCDTPLISPGADHSIFNSYCYAAPTVDQATETALPDKYHQSSKQSLRGAHEIRLRQKNNLISPRIVGLAKEWCYI